MLEELTSLEADLEELTGDSRIAQEAISTLISRLRHRQLMEQPSTHEEVRIRRTPAITFKDAVLGVLAESADPLPAATILERARDRGAVTASREPVALTDLTLWKLKKAGAPIQKVEGAPRTWVRVRDEVTAAG